MKKAKNKVIYLVCFAAVFTAICTSSYAKQVELVDFRAPYKSLQLTRMQEYHMQNAQLKISNEQFAYAWGDLAYILCQIPNHHIALQDMLQIAPQLHKQDELRQYFEKAMKLFPDDQELQALYSKLDQQKPATTVE